MARIRSLNPGTQNVTVHPSAVDCFHQVITGPDNEVLLHLSTFGSDKRDSPPKSSQSLQIDKAMAVNLLAVLAATFPGIVFGGRDFVLHDDLRSDQLAP